MTYATSSDFARQSKSSKKINAWLDAFNGSLAKALVTRHVLGSEIPPSPVSDLTEAICKQCGDELKHDWDNKLMGICSECDYLLHKV